MSSKDLQTPALVIVFRPGPAHRRGFYDLGRSYSQRRQRKVQMSSLRRDKWWTGLLCRDKSRSCFTLGRSDIFAAAVLFCSGFCLPRRQSVCRQALHRRSAHCFPHKRSPWRTFPKDEAPALKARYSSHLALSQFGIVKRRQKDPRLLEYELRIRDWFMSGFHKKMKRSPASYDGSRAGIGALTSYVRRVIACIRGCSTKIGYVHLSEIN